MPQRNADQEKEVLQVHIFFNLDLMIQECNLAPTGAQEVLICDLTLSLSRCHTHRTVIFLPSSR